MTTRCENSNRHCRRRFLSSAICCIFGAAVFTTVGGAATRTNTDAGAKLAKVTVAGFPSAGQLQFEVGIKKGFFAKHGVSLSYTANNNLAVLPAAAVANQFNFVMTVAPIFISAVKQNLPVVATLGGALESTEPLALVVPAKSGISAAADLEGKSVATGAIAGNFSFCLRYWMYANGAHNTAANLKLVPITNMPAQLDAGLVDSALINAPFSNAVLATGSYKSLGDPCRAIGTTPAAPQLLAFDISNASWAKSHKKLIGQVRAGINDANAWIQTHPAQAQAIDAAFSGVPASVFQGQKPPKFFDHETRVDIYRWERAMQAIGVLPSLVDVSNSFVGP